MKGDAERVQRLCVLAPKNMTDPTCCKTGKAVAFTKEHRSRMNKTEYAEYLKSDHWKLLKLKKSKVAKRCWCCRCKPKPSNFHHIRYKQIYDVKTRDLRLLCEDCHQFYHALKSERPYLPEAKLWKHTRKMSKACSPFTHPGADPICL